MPKTPSISAADLLLNRDGSVYHLNLLPQHLSDTIITVGDPERVALVSQYFDHIDFKIHRREFITHVGHFRGKRLTVISTGIGTDNVEIVLTELDALANIDLTTRQEKLDKTKLKIIRIGTSGALQEDIPVGSFLVSDYAVGFDNLGQFYPLPETPFESAIAKDIQSSAGLNFQPYITHGSARLLKAVGTDMLVGNTVTCPGFYAPQGRKTRIPVKFPSFLDDLSNYQHREHNFRLTNFEMETSGYYALGSLLGHEILSVNAIIVNRMENTVAADPNKVVDSLIQKVLERVHQI